MRAYKFSLEKILEWRENTEKDTAKVFASIQNELEYQKNGLSSLRLEDENIKKNILKINSINELRQQYLFKQSIEEKIEKQIDLIDKTTEKLENQRLELLEAQKNRKIMEKLKEKDYETYKDNEMYEEQKELDDMAVLRYGKTGTM